MLIIVHMIVSLIDLVFCSIAGAILPEHDRVQQTVPDAMHTVKDVIE